MYLYVTRMHSCVTRTVCTRMHAYVSRVRLKCGSGYGTERILRNGTERNGYGVKTRNGTERNGYGVKMRNGTERNGYGVKMRNGTERIWG